MERIALHTTNAGRRIYTIPVRSFPGLVSNIFVISDGARLILVDTGSGQPDANADLLAGLAAIGEQHGETVTLADVGQIVITHGHIDHYGGLPFVRRHSSAPIGVHVLDRRVLSNHEERVAVAARRLTTFLQEAGVDEPRRQKMMQMYLFSKGIYRSTPVDFLLEEGVALNGDIQLFHTPGHCPGQVCLLLDDIMLTADHILSRTTPHQAPESITRHMGLYHYFAALDKIAAVGGIRLGLGNHEDPMTDVYGRIVAIRQMHEDRLQRVLEICAGGPPQTIVEISRALFGRVRNYHILLALEETGAHVEYLYQRGELVAANVAEIEQTPYPVIRYERA